MKVKVNDMKYLKALFIAVFFTGAVILFDHFLIEKPLNRTPATKTSTENLGWKLTMIDEFSDPQNEFLLAQEHNLDFDITCYQGQEPICEYEFWQKRTCEKWKNGNINSRSHLANLNKCRWVIYNVYNYMDFNIGEGKGVNAFDESQVEVRNGKLYLKANINPDWSIDDCGNIYKDPTEKFKARTRNCRFLSGGIHSVPRQNNKGFEQTYGRWEIRAKLPKGAGAWPALWMMPHGADQDIPRKGSKQRCPWPYNGEIDILETWVDSPFEPHQGYIHGDCSQSLKFEKGFSKKQVDVEQFHNYGVEWNEQNIKFFIDDHITGNIRKDDLVRAFQINDAGEKTQEVQRQLAWIVAHPFHLIMNLTIEGVKKGIPQLETFKEQALIIDYVKVYRRCTADEYKDDPDQCETFKTDRNATVSQYQTTKNETATSYLKAYPNPSLSGQEIQLEFVMDQFCKDVQIGMYSVDGKLIDANVISSTIANGDSSPMIYNGTIDNVGINHFIIRPPRHTAAGFYIIMASYRQCFTGFDYSGYGNQAWKHVIIK